MKSLFVRLYLLLFLSLVLSAVGLDALYAYYQTALRNEQAEPDATQWLWQAQHGPASAGRWLPITDLHWPAAEQAQLQQQRSLQLQDGNGELFFYGLSADNQQVYVLPLPQPAADHRHWYWLLAYYATLALVIFLWLRPLVRDIDKLRKAVRGLDRPTAELINPIHQRSALTPVAEALRDLRRHTVELMALQRDISNAVSHDIRTPLARIKFALAMLPADTDHHLLQGIQTDINEIEQLVDEMLRYAEFEHRVPVLNKQHIDLRPFVEALVQRYSHHHNVKISVDIAEGSTLLFDANCLQRLLQNLLDNALRYANGRVLIAWQYTEQGSRLSVEDDGAGLSLPMQQDLGAEFAAEGARSGYGLGLAIVQKIALWHGATVQRGRSTSLGGACIGIVLRDEVSSSSTILRK